MLRLLHLCDSLFPLGAFVVVNDPGAGGETPPSLAFPDASVEREGLQAPVSLPGAQA